MSNKLQTLTPIAAMLAMSLTGVAHAAETPASAPTATMAKDASCGAKKTADAKCGAKKTAEAKCGAEKKTTEGKCGGHKAAKGGMKEGKCGEAKCGADKGKKMENGMVVQK